MHDEAEPDESEQLLEEEEEEEEDGGAVGAAAMEEEKERRRGRRRGRRDHARMAEVEAEGEGLVILWWCRRMRGCIGRLTGECGRALRCARLTVDVVAALKVGAVVDTASGHSLTGCTRRDWSVGPCERPQWRLLLAGVTRCRQVGGVGEGCEWQ